MGEDSDEAEFTLWDLGSTNGTKINGKNLVKGEKEAVRLGDFVQLGGVRLTLAKVNRSCVYG